MSDLNHVYLILIFQTNVLGSIQNGPDHRIYRAQTINSFISKSNMFIYVIIYLSAGSIPFVWIVYVIIDYKG